MATPARRVLLIGALTTAIVGACDGNGLGPPADCPWPMGEVCGEWRLVQISGGIGSPPPVTEDARLVLYADSSFALAGDGLQVSGEYDILRYDGPDNIFGDSIWLAELDAEAGAPVDRLRWKIELSGPERLRLDDLFVDGFQYDYERVSAVYR